MEKTIQIKEAIKIHSALEKYQDDLYLGFARQFNEKADTILKDNMGKEFVDNCGRDIAGEVIRNCFQTSDYYITVDQLVKRLLSFDYKNEYDPLSDQKSKEQISKNVYAFNDTTNTTLLNDAFSKIGVELPNSRVKFIEKELVDANQKKLFEKEKYTDKNGKEKSRYKDYRIIKDGKEEYVNKVKNDDGSITDEYTGQEGDFIIDKNGNKRRRLEVDHNQALASATYNEKFLKDNGVQELKLYYNSENNFAMMDKIANESKGDVKVYDREGNDITHRATPEQMADAVCNRWENVKSDKTRKELQDKGYLDENGKVPKSVKKQLISNVRKSQNGESVVILKNTKYGEVTGEAGKMMVSSLGKIVAGQIIYYVAPPLLFEVRMILKEKKITLEDTIEKIGSAGKRIGNYVLSHLKDIFKNIAFNSLKTFVKSFMDILIALVKATVKKLLKLGKNLVLATVDATRVLIDRNASPSEKADAIFNLYGVTITSCVVELLFDFASTCLHLPPLLEDIVFGPLQILTTVICTNLTMLILKKLDLFDVQYGFKIANIRKIFEEERDEYNRKLDIATNTADQKINMIIDQTKLECRKIYDNLAEIDIKQESARPTLEKINDMFSMGIDFEDEWQKFIGIV